MAKRRLELVAPMITYLHRVMKIQQNVGGLAWLQYDGGPAKSSMLVVLLSGGGRTLDNYWHASLTHQRYRTHLQGKTNIWEGL